MVRFNTFLHTVSTFSTFNINIDHLYHFRHMLHVSGNNGRDTHVNNIEIGLHVSEEHHADSQ